MTDEEESGNVAPSTSVGSGTSAGAQAGWDSSVDIGSPAGPEPSLRTIIQHYYESHGIRQAKARSLTLQYIAAAPPAPSAWLPDDRLDFIAAIADLSMGLIRAEANKILAKYGRPTVPLSAPYSPPPPEKTA